jgi:hypothetical protein
LSAIPVFGHDLVESNYAVEFSTCLTSVRAITYSGQQTTGLAQAVSEANIPDAGREASFLELPTVGTVSTHALKKGKKIRLDKSEFLSLPSQFIAFLVGLIDGDGYIRINKTTKGYIAINLVIGISLEDISTLEYIYSVLKLGKITKYPDHRNPTCRLIINRTDLQEVIFPLLIHHNIFFLTETRRAQFDLAIFILKKELKIYDKISVVLGTNNIPSIFLLPKTALEYVSLSFFKN